MKSFKSIITGIGKVIAGILKYEPAAAAVVEQVLPPTDAAVVAGVDQLVVKVQASILNAETNLTDASGQVRSTVVNADINSYLEAFNAGLALAGKKAVETDPALRQTVIDAFVAAYNAAAAWTKSFKQVPLQIASTAGQVAPQVTQVPQAGQVTQPPPVPPAAS